MSAGKHVNHIGRCVTPWVLVCNHGVRLLESVLTLVHVSHVTKADVS